MSDPRCKCTMSISMVGDGCRYCQPQEHIDRLSDIISDMESEAEPTHYAVIDEHGEMWRAIKVAACRDAKIVCKDIINDLKSYNRAVENWTVKGVTVHKE